MASDYLKLYEDYLREEKHASENTLSSYLRDLRQFSEHLAAQRVTDLRKVRTAAISDYVAWMGGKGKSAATVTRALASIKSFYAFLAERGEIKTNPAKGVAALKVERRFPEILTGKEVELFLDQPRCVDAKGYRDHAMLELLYATGIRVSELISLSMQGRLDNGDEGRGPTPDYPLWTASVTLAGGKAVHYICDEQSNWYPDIEDMRRKVTDKTKGIVVINPNNPTGALYPREILEQIVAIAREHDLILFADEIYDRLVMDGKEHTALSSLAPDLLPVSLTGLSKSHLAAGYRCGWMCLAGDKSRAKGYIEGINLLSAMRLCSNVPAQSIIAPALAHRDETKKLLVPGGRVYEQREVIYNRLRSIPGISVTKPDAAFYIFPKMDVKKFNIHDDELFALDLLKQEKILITHGGGFHWIHPDHFRIVYLPDVDLLNRACNRLAHFFAGYHQK